MCYVVTRDISTFLISFSLIHSLLCGGHLLHWNKSNIRCSSLFSFRITTFEFGWVAFIRRRYALAWVLVKPSVSSQAIARGGKQISSVGSPIAPLWSTWEALCSASFDRLESVSLRCAFRLSWRWSNRWGMILLVLVVPMAAIGGGICDSYWCCWWYLWLLLVLLLLLVVVSWSMIAIVVAVGIYGCYWCCC